MTSVPFPATEEAKLLARFGSGRFTWRPDEQIFAAILLKAGLRSDLERVEHFPITTETRDAYRASVTFRRWVNWEKGGKLNIAPVLSPEISRRVYRWDRSARYDLSYSAFVAFVALARNAWAAARAAHLTNAAQQDGRAAATVAAAS